MTALAAQRERDTMEVTITARAFASDRRPREVSCLVDADGTVRVWDAVARSFTLCHRLSAAAKSEARRLAGV